MENILRGTLKLVVKLSFAAALIAGMFLSAYLAVTQFDRTSGNPSFYDYIVIASAIGLALTFLMLSLKLNFKDSGTSNTPLTQNHPVTNKKGVSMGVFDKKRDLIKTLSEEDIQAYFGDESIKYEKVKAKADQGKSLYWSWWAFIFGGIWAGYNKWWYGIFVSVVVWFLGGWVGAIALNIVLGLYGQFLYLASAAKQIKDIKEKSASENETKIRLKKKGKASVLIAILAIILLNLAMWFGALLYQGSAQSTLSFNNNTEKVTSSSEVADEGVHIEGKIIEYQTDPVFVSQWPFEAYVNCIDKSKYDVSFRKSIFNPIVMDIADKQGNKIGYIAFAESKRPNHYVIVNSDVSQIDNYTEKMNLAEGIARLSNEGMPSYVRNFLIMQMPFKDSPDC